MHVAGVAYGPGDEVPSEVARRITNPNAWEGGVPPSFDDEGPSQPPKAEPHFWPGVDGPAMTEPPRSGAGSGRAVWMDYAAARGLEVPADASRDDIIAAVDKAKPE